MKWPALEKRRADVTLQKMSADWTSHPINDNGVGAANTAPSVASHPVKQPFRNVQRRASQQSLLRERGPVPDAQTREEIDAKIAASEARNETKIARLEGKLDLLLEKANQAAMAAEQSEKAIKEEGRATRANIVVLGTALALLIIGLVALFPVIFDLGEHIREMVEQAVATKH